MAKSECGFHVCCVTEKASMFCCVSIGRCGVGAGWTCLLDPAPHI